MRIRKFMSLAVIIMAVMLLAGCEYEERVVVNSDGSVRSDAITWYTSDEIRTAYSEETGKDGFALTEKEIEGYVSQSTDYLGSKTGADGSVLYGGIVDTAEGPDVYEGSSEYSVSATEFVFVPDTSDDDGDDIGLSPVITFNVTMPEKIILTNGKLSADGLNSVFTSDGTEVFYAYTESSDNIITLSKLTGPECTKNSKIYVNSYDKIKTIRVNGKKQTAKTVKTPEDGTYTVEVTSAHAKKTFSIIRDTAKPKVSGVSSKKTYAKTVTVKFSDSLSGIASATLNGEPVKSGTKVSKNGSYKLVVTDNAGNKKTVSFTIAK